MAPMQCTYACSRRFRAMLCLADRRAAAGGKGQARFLATGRTVSGLNNGAAWGAGIRSVGCWLLVRFGKFLQDATLRHPAAVWLYGSRGATAEPILPRGQCLDDMGGCWAIGCAAFPAVRLVWSLGASAVTSVRRLVRRPFPR